MAERNPAVDAARAHTDLTIFYAVIAILEGGTIGSDSYRGAERIIAICKSETAKCLKRYDRACAQAGKEPRP